VLFDSGLTVLFDHSDSSVRFGFALSTNSGSFGSVRLAKDMGSSSVRVLFDSHLYFGSVQSVVKFVFNLIWLLLHFRS